MANKPNRAKMCSWLSMRLYGVRILPSNPADIQTLVKYARLADRKIQRLQVIAGELGWHADASLDYAAELITEFDAEFYPSPIVSTPPEEGH